MRAMLGAAVATIVPSSISMKNAPATSKASGRGTPAGRPASVTSHRLAFARLDHS
jgi:hypothetical protein